MSVISEKEQRDNLMEKLGDSFDTILQSIFV